jgi:hypothetical protein
MTALEINFHGIPLVIRGTYQPPEPDVGLQADFVIHSIQAKVTQASKIAWLELSDDEWESGVYEYLHEEALSAYIDQREGERCEADEARAEARRDKEIS